MQEGPPLKPIWEAPMEVEDGTIPAQVDSAMAEEENYTVAEQAT